MKRITCFFSHLHLNLLKSIGVLLFIVFAGHPLNADDLGVRKNKLYQSMEWTLSDITCSGNPFDLVAKVTFKHPTSGESVVTEMFFAGDNTWKFRFTGTRTGKWIFSTQADGRNGTDKKPALDGHTGIIHVRSDNSAEGFLVHSGNKFAVQSGDAGSLKGYVFNVYMNKIHFPNRELDLYDNAKIDAYCSEALNNGFEIIFFHVVHNFFRFGAISYNDHNRTDPDLKTFDKLDQIITRTRKNGCRVMLWAWGDEQRKWTPVGMEGGINGTADRRLQRYIAARLGPLPGWSMGYGFDLQEWVNEQQLYEWQDYMHKHMGWPHLLSARGYNLKEAGNINGYSIPYRSSELLYALPFSTVEEIIKQLEADPQKPHLYEERHAWKRWDLNESQTRRLLWRTVMAGGMGGWYGFYDDTPYPYPESLTTAMITHYKFWHKKDRFRLDLSRGNDLTDGYCLKTPDSRKFIIYKEDASSIVIDLSDMPEAQRAFAVNTKNPYKEVDLGTLSPKKQSIQLNTSSDWIIVIGY